jgi:hypothetical protein
VAPPDRPAGSRTVDELLALVRSRIERVEPVEAWHRLTGGALLVDTRSVDVVGGFVAWAAAGLPVVGGRADEVAA